MKKLSLAEIAKSLKEEQDFSWIHDYVHIEDIFNDVAEGKIKYLGDARGIGKKWFEISKQENIPTAVLGGGTLAIYAPGAGVSKMYLADIDDSEIEGQPFSPEEIKDYLKGAADIADGLSEVEVAPEPTIKPSTPGTKPRRPNPLRPPKTAPKPSPKASEEDIIQDITDKFLKLNEKRGKYSISEMLSEINVDDVKKKFVGRGKVVDDKQFSDIMKATSNKLALALWMIKRIEDGFILPEDIYKWEDYFDIFKRRKNQYPVKDINQIKTEDDIDDFVNKSVELIDLEKDPTQKKGVSKEDKFKDLQIGEVAGFKVYKIPQGTSDEMYGAACELGSGTSWCTATGNTKQWFDRYAKDGPLYIFIGPDGEKYQFHYESNQYMDKNDRSILSRNF